MQKQSYDLIIIGGGATGSGIALDATLRGLKCLILEQNDFSQGTSSRSTKLVHGGVRYLEAAIKNFDLAQFKLVKEGLKERYRLLQNASFLAKPICLTTPLYKYFEIPYIYIGLSIYDFISGKKSLGRSKIVSKDHIINKFPYINKHKLKGGVQYFDGMFNDSRMVISLLQTAKKEGCDVCNYTKVIEFIYNKDTISGVKVQNQLTKEINTIYATNIINSTGVFADTIRKLDDNESKNIINASSGLHIVLDKKYLPNNIGLMIPKTQDGRVLFMLPYLGKCLVGTTDENAKITTSPQVEQKDIDYLLKYIKIYFDVEIQKEDILSSWVGLRPLVVPEKSLNTKDIVREHFIQTSKSGLISIVGGKWTTYRKMAEETIDTLIKNTNINLRPCQTKNFKLLGNQLNRSTLKEELSNIKLDSNIKQHLLDTYGDQIIEVYKYIQKYGDKKIDPNYNITIAEIYYCVDHEFVKTANDFLTRRINLSLIDKNTAKLCFELINNIISNYNIR